jgi:hypothetical protein
MRTARRELLDQTFERRGVGRERGEPRRIHLLPRAPESLEHSPQPHTARPEKIEHDSHGLHRPAFRDAHGPVIAVLVRVSFDDVVQRHPEQQRGCVLDAIQMRAERRGPKAFDVAATEWKAEANPRISVAHGRPSCPGSPAYRTRPRSSRAAPLGANRTRALRAEPLADNAHTRARRRPPRSYSWV